MSSSEQYYGSKAIGDATALIHAAQMGNADLVELLLDRGT